LTDQNNVKLFLRKERSKPFACQIGTSPKLKKAVDTFVYQRLLNDWESYRLHHDF